MDFGGKDVSKYAGKIGVNSGPVPLQRWLGRDGTPAKRGQSVPGTDLRMEAQKRAKKK